MVQKIISDIKAALDNDLYYAALISALTLPDICGKVAFPNEKVRKRYIDWYDQEIGYYERNPNSKLHDKMPYLSGEVVYSLRCSLLHSGIPNVDNDQLIRDGELPIDFFILKIEKQKEYNFYSDTSEMCTLPGMQRRSYTMSIRRVCGILCDVAEQYYIDHKDCFSFNYNVIDWDEIVSKSAPVDYDSISRTLEIDNSE